MSTVKVGDTTEQISETSPGLPAVEAAMDRLLILSVNIRRSARRTHRLRQGTRDPQDELLCRLLQTKYPHARRSLCSQLCASISVRGRSLQYLQEHNKKLAYRRENQDDLKRPANDEDRPKEEANAPVVPMEEVASKKQKPIQNLETLPSTVSHSAIVRLNRMKRTPSSTIISRGSTVRDGEGNEYNYPPQPKQKGGNKYQSCTICAVPLEVSTLTRYAWKYALAFPDVLYRSS